MTAFDEFSLLLARLKDIIKSTKTYRSCAAKREKLWIAFHQVRFSKIPVK